MNSHTHSRLIGWRLELARMELRNSEFKDAWCPISYHKRVSHEYIRITAADPSSIPLHIKWQISGSKDSSEVGFPPRRAISAFTFLPLEQATVVVQTDIPVASCIYHSWHPYCYCYCYYCFQILFNRPIFSALFSQAEMKLKIYSVRLRWN